MTTDTMRAAVGAMEWMLRKIDAEICTHEETYRGGAIWTICRNCGMKWADDRGGFTPYREPKQLTNARSALSLLRAALEEGGEPKPVATDAAWLIHYDDADRRPEIVVGEAGARARFARISDNWNAHLFVKVASNSRDSTYHQANITLAASPTAAPKEEAPALHPNHLPDLRYVLKVLQGAHVPERQHGDVQAAIKGMRYIIKRTKEATAKDGGQHG